MITRAIGAGQRGRLRMSLTRSLTGGVAGEIVASYRSRYPEVDLTLTIASSREA
jgi:DNA-binding transcriptional LysR family regulator